MSQTEIDPVRGACRHMRIRYKLQTSHKSPFPEKRFLRYECEQGHEIDNTSDEDVQKCLDSGIACWREAPTA